MEAVWREGVRECVVASRVGKRRVDRRALTELSAPALHLGHCHAVVGGGHTFATEKLATCELAYMFIIRAFFHATCTNALTPCHCRRRCLPPPLAAAANFSVALARLVETSFELYRGVGRTARDWWMSMPIKNDIIMPRWLHRSLPTEFYN